MTHNHLVSNQFVLVGRDVDIEEHRLGKNPASTLQDQGVNKSRSMGATRTNLIDQ